MTFAFSSITLKKKIKMLLLYVDQEQAAASFWNCSRDFGICSDDMKNSTPSTKSLLTKQI